MVPTYARVLAVGEVRSEGIVEPTGFVDDLHMHCKQKAELREREWQWVDFKGGLHSVISSRVHYAQKGTWAYGISSRIKGCHLNRQAPELVRSGLPICRGRMVLHILFHFFSFQL
jgi:hypothetical protein